MMNTAKKINKLNLTTSLPFQLVWQVITQRLASQLCKCVNKTFTHLTHGTQKINILCKTNIKLYCQIKFSSRNILIKIGHFQETPTACPSIKENHNKIENLPYGYDLKKKKKKRADTQARSPILKSDSFLWAMIRILNRYRNKT